MLTTTSPLIDAHRTHQKNILIAEISTGDSLKIGLSKVGKLFIVLQRIIVL